jgi:hypothetical protein
VKPVDRNVLLIQVFQGRPPRSVKIVDVVPLTKTINYTPVCIWHCKPLAIPRANVDIN